MENKQTKSTFSYLKGLTLHNNGKYIMSIILAVIGVALGLIPYFAVAKMVIHLVDGGKDLSFYKFWCGVCAISYIAKVLFATWSTGLSHKATFITLQDIRKKLISKLSRMPMGTLLDTPSGQFKDIIVDRVESLEVPLAHLLPEMTANILVPIAIILYLFVLDWRMAIVSLITLPIGMVFVMSIMKRYPEQYAESVKTSKRMNEAVVEYVNGIEVIKAFNQSANSYGKYSDAVNDNADYFYSWMKSCQIQMSIYKAVFPAVLITVLPIGFVFYLNRSISIPEFITIIILSLGVVGPILSAINFTDSLAMVGTVVEQIKLILESPELVRPTSYAKLKGLTINMKNVSFSYNKDSDKKVLKNVNLNIVPGTVTALIGPSGSGKSTIAKLIAGFWDVSQGEITIGGVNLKEISQKQLADQIAYVAQDNYLFDDTIRENIRLGRTTATDKEVEEAAKAAGCHEFISKLEYGYDTKTGGAGGHLSGGERQRIAIARAMLKNAPIVILDEATAYTDPENEAVIQCSVSKLVKGKTLIVIAHRLSTITDSDQIIVIKNGIISAKGKHNELLKASSLYKEMWEAHVNVKDGEEI